MPWPVRLPWLGHIRPAAIPPLPGIRPASRWPKPPKGGTAAVPPPKVVEGTPCQEVDVEDIVARAAVRSLREMAEAHADAGAPIEVKLKLIKRAKEIEAAHNAPAPMGGVWNKHGDLLSADSVSFLVIASATQGLAFSVQALTEFPHECAGIMSSWRPGMTVRDACGGGR